MRNDQTSKVVKAGSTTYFFDIKSTKDGKSFLVITSSRFKGDSEERERNSILLFPEYKEAFLNALQEIIQDF